jgi:hypothetical protein
MDDTQAHKIISALADGCDPTTGDRVEGSILQHGDVIRALHIAVRALEKNVRSNARGSRARMPANAGKPWTEQEDRELLEKFDAGHSVAQLAQAHDRTAAGIHARLERHGRLQGPSPQWRGRAVNAMAGTIGRERSET